MQNVNFRSLLWLGLFTPILATAAASHTRANLLLPYTQVEPGASFHAAIEMRMSSGWHIYWKNPGESGAPTRLQWDLPAHFRAGNIEWPVPRKWTVAGLTTYGYSGSVILLVPFRVAPDTPPGVYALSAELNWLECFQTCIPGRQAVSGTVRVGPTSEPRRGKFDRILEAQSLLPGSEFAQDIKISVQWENGDRDGDSDSDERRLLFQIGPISDGEVGRFDFFPDQADDFEISGITDRYTVTSNNVSFRKKILRFSGDWPEKVEGLLVTTTGNPEKTSGVKVKIPVSQ